MSTDPDLDALREAIVPQLARFELALEELAVRERSGRAEITLVVDLPEDCLGAVDLDTVAEASTAVSELLDSRPELLGEGPSLLEVTTPGVDRALREARHFLRARGRLVELPAQKGESALRGRVLALDGQDVVLRLEPGRDERGRPRRLPAGAASLQRIPLERAAGARVQVEFDPPADLEALIASAEQELAEATAPKEN